MNIVLENRFWLLVALLFAVVVIAGKVNLSKTGHAPAHRAAHSRCVSKHFTRFCFTAFSAFPAVAE